MKQNAPNAGLSSVTGLRPREQTRTPKQVTTVDNMYRRVWPVENLALPHGSLRANSATPLGVGSFACALWTPQSDHRHDLSQLGTPS